jgi:hypothetical protein
MSVNLYVYVGPHLKCYPKGACEYVPDATDDQLMELRCGPSHDADCDLVGPNDDIPGVNRVLEWSRHEDSETVVDQPAPRLEMNRFETHFLPAITKLRKIYDRVVVSWGVVPRWQ